MTHPGAHEATVRVLARNGYRVLVPYLRGYGATRFLSSDAFRNGQPSALAVDVIDFMNALKIEKAILAGFDWGARSADIVAALWPVAVLYVVAFHLHLLSPLLVLVLFFALIPLYLRFWSGKWHTGSA